MDEYCKENNFSAWFETSAKENINIDEAAKSLVTQVKNLSTDFSVLVWIYLQIFHKVTVTNNEKSPMWKSK